jgi:hypothetical protein
MTDTTKRRAHTQNAGAAFQQNLSSWNARFLRMATSDHRYRTEAGSVHSFLGLPVHSWPTFVDTARIEEWTRLTVSLRHLILKDGVSLIPSDTREIAELFGYSVQRASLVARLLTLRERSYIFASRGDFLLSDDRLKCCEFDFGDVGLWHVITFVTMFRHSPVVQDMVSYSGVNIRERDPLQTMARELLKLVGRREPGDECNFGILLPDDISAKSFEANRLEVAYASSRYQAALRTLGFDGEILLERASGLDVRGDRASIGGKRIQVVMTQTPTLEAEDEVWAAASLLDLVERDGVVALNGPHCYAISNKIVLALLSEAADTGKLNGADAELVRSTIPWTRRVTASTVKYQEREQWLPELLMTCKNDFVLKPGEGFASGGVLIGRNTSASEWERAAATALQHGTWIVQEAIGGTPMWFPGEDDRPAPHGVNIGIVVCGDEYVGTFLRLMPLGSADEMPIIGYSLGALTGGVIEVES